MNDRIRKPTTTDAGFQSPAMSSRSPLGPTALLLQDHYLIEQMANFNRERIPQRQPHAKGGGAFGRFQVTKDVSKYTKAAMFQPGTKTDMLVRFSTVAGERGRPDRWRNPRGPRVDQVHSKSRKTEKIISNGVAPRRFDSTRLRCPLRDNNSEAEQVLLTLVKE